MRTRINVRTMGILALCLFANAASAQAALVSSNPVADAFVAASNPNSNYGGAGSLSAASATLPNGEFASVLRFDTAAAKTSFDTTYGAGQWTIQDVSLRLTAVAPNNAIFNASGAGQFGASWMQNDSWVEGSGTPTAPGGTGITFNSLPSVLSGSDAALGTFGFNGATSGSVTYTLGLPLNFVMDIQGGNLVSLRLFAADASISYLFNSRSFGTVASRPELAITAIPEPAGLSILMLGFCLVCRRNRRN
jgi:hypothetical protein